MASILEELWYGNIETDKVSDEAMKEIKKHMDKLCKSEKELSKSLDENQTILFEDFKANREEIGLITEKEHFINGFTLGAKIMIECMERDLWPSDR